MGISAMGPYQIKEIEHHPIRMPDGIELAARLFLPVSKDPVPAILEYIPYRKRDFTRARDEGMHPYFASYGYACARVDIRGSGDSEGFLADEYLASELEDGVQIISWLAEQGWCDGNVGMMGKSWGAYNALQVAALNPPELKAILPVMGTDNRYTDCIHYLGGGLMTDDFWWSCIMQIFNARPPSPEVFGERWREIWRERLEGQTFWSHQWLKEQSFTDFWKHGSICTDYAEIQCPVYYWGGWGDSYRDPGFRLPEHLDVPVKVAMGPWSHLYPHDGVPGPAVGFLQEALRWWDYWLKGKDSGIMDEPLLRYWMMDHVAPNASHKERPGKWVAEPGWPSPNVVTETVNLADGMELISGELEVNTPLTALANQGDWMSFALLGDFPGDQTLDEEGCAVFETPALEEGAALLGQPEVSLSVSADKTVAQLFVRLSDVDEKGHATLITRGFLALANRDGHEDPQALVPGEAVDATFKLHGIAYHVPAGHRLRLSVASHFWPVVWPSAEPATLTLHPKASLLTLPVRVTGESGGEPFGPPLSATAGKVETVRPGSIERTVTVDPETGVQTHRSFIEGGVFGDVGVVKLVDTGLTMTHNYDRRYAIKPGDATSETAEMTQSYSLTGAGMAVEIKATARMTTDGENFDVSASVEAYDGGTLFVRRDWHESIPRGFL